MVEKLLVIQRFAERYNTSVLTNYVVPSNIAAANMLDAGQIDDLRKLVI